MARKYFIAGNWKMNKTASEAVVLINEINAKAGSQTKVDVAVCPTFTALDAASKALKGSTVKLGAQNMYTKESGAYTGEIAANMLKEFEADPRSIWESNMFGKTLYELINEGLHTKLDHMPEESRKKLSHTLERIINEGSNGLICILL